MTQRNYFPFVMKAVMVISLAATLILCLLCSLFPSVFAMALAITAGTTCYHFAMRLAVGYVIPKLIPQRAVTWKWFQPKDFETKLYSALRVKGWKDRMPTYAPESFSLRHNTLEQIVYNCCVSEAVHEGIVLLSFVPLFFALIWGAFPVFLITSVLSALFDSCFIIMQRYNRPRLVRILSKKGA